jgi:hypothetical protein
VFFQDTKCKHMLDVKLLLLELSLPPNSTRTPKNWTDPGTTFKHVDYCEEFCLGQI